MPRDVDSDAGTSPRSQILRNAGLTVVAGLAALGLATAPAAAEEPQAACDAAAFTAAFNNAADGAAVTLCGDVTVSPDDAPLTVTSGTSVTLDLDGHTLEVTGPELAAGISVPADAALRIEDGTGGGALQARGGASSAAIGGGSGDSAGSITIAGGTVTLTAPAGGAGIGGGNHGAGGDVTITGGTVDAQGGARGAGIGGGGSGDAGTLTVTGGAIKALGIYGGAGIGGGADYGEGPGDGGDVTITGGTVTAGTTSLGAGIGGGAAVSGDVDGGMGGTVHIGGDARVTAGGGMSYGSIGGGAGIGGGGARTGQGGAGGDVVIDDGADVTVISGHNPDNGSSDSTAIGGGNNCVGAGCADSPETGEFGTLHNAGTLHVAADSSIAVPTGATATNPGTITGAGALSGAGTITNSGAIAHTVAVAEAPLTVTEHNYLLEFRVQGGTVAPEQMTVYAAALADAELSASDLPVPALDDRDFDAWYLDAAATDEPVGDDTVLSADLSGDGTPIDVPLHSGWVQNDPPMITTASLPDGVVGEPYQTAVAATGGAAPLVWEIVDGALPAGLTLAPDTGAIAGTPEAAGSAALTVRVTDEIGLTDEIELTVTVADAPVVPDPTPPDTNDTDVLPDDTDGSGGTGGTGGTDGTDGTTELPATGFDAASSVPYLGAMGIGLLFAGAASVLFARRAARR